MTSSPRPLQDQGRARPEATGPQSVAAIVLAAGSGERFGGPKQFEPLTPTHRLVDAAVATVTETAPTTIVVLPEPPPPDPRRGPEPSTNTELPTNTEPSTNTEPATNTELPSPAASPTLTVRGGADRASSMRAGLAALPPECTIVLVHAASHPLASSRLAASVVAAVHAGAAAAVPFLPAADVIKRLGPQNTTQTIGRDGLGAAQMPMAFDRSVLEQVHRQPAGASVEDSQMVEAAGHRVVAVAGEATNIHVVDRATLRIAQRLAGIVVSSDNPPQESS